MGPIAHRDLVHTHVPKLHVGVALYTDPLWEPDGGRHRPDVPEPSPSHMDTSSSSTSSWPGYRGKGCRLACSPRAHGTSRMGEHLAQQSSPISKFARRRYVRSSSPAQTWYPLGRPSSGWLRLQILPPGKDAPSSPSGSSLRPGLVHNPQRS